MTAVTGFPVAAVLVAGGSGTRLGAAVPKAFVEVAGRTLLDHALTAFADHPDVRDIVVVVPLGTRVRLGFTIVTGGATRQESVSNGLAALAPDIEVVLVHDVARPFVPAAVISAVVAAIAAGADAAIPVVNVHDTVRRVRTDGTLAGVVDRASLVAVQTPQGFRRAVLDAAHAAGRELAVTDDAALVEAAGGTVVAVPGSEDSFKITTPADLARAAAVAQRAAGIAD